MFLLIARIFLIAVLIFASEGDSFFQSLPAAELEVEIEKETIINFHRTKIITNNEDENITRHNHQLYFIPRSQTICTANQTYQGTNKLQPRVPLYLVYQSLWL